MTRSTGVPRRDAVFGTRPRPGGFADPELVAPADGEGVRPDGRAMFQDGLPAFPGVGCLR